MTRETRLLVPIFAITAIMAVNAPARAFAQETAQFIAAPDNRLTLEFSAATTKTTTTAKKTRRHVIRRHVARHATIRTHKAAKVTLRHKLTQRRIIGLKAGAMPHTATKGPVYRTNMDPSPAPSPGNAPPPEKKPASNNPATTTVINDFKTIKEKIRAKNPNATDVQLNTATIQVINRRKKEAADKAAEEKRRAYWQWKKRDNEETNRLRKEQEARENFNPNADTYNERGITPEEKELLNQKSLPGKPNGTED